MRKRRQIKNVELDLPYGADEMGLTPDVAEEITGKVADAFQEHLLGLATERLSSETALKYVNSVVRVAASESVRFYISTRTKDGKLIDMMETGHEPFYLNINVAPGQQVIIPFMHTTPGRGKSPMPRKVYAAASKLTQRTGQQRGSALGAGVGGATPQPLSSAKLGMNTGSGISSTDYYNRMVRTENTEGTGSKYLTFRSMKSRDEQPDHWLHPGFRALNLLDEAVERVMEDAQDIVTVTIKER
jgi:hypothetical protein